MSLVRALGGSLFVLALGATVAAQGFQGAVAKVDGTATMGSLRVARDGTAQVTPMGGAPWSCKVDELASVRFATVPAQAQPVVFRVLLRSGGTLPVVAMTDDADGKRVVLKTTTGTEVAVPRTAIGLVRNETMADTGTLAADRSEPADTRDYLYVLRDNAVRRFSVTVNGFPEGKVSFQLQGKDYQVESASLAGIVFGKSTGFAPDPLPMPRVRVKGPQGLVLNGQLVEVGEALTMRLDEGAEVALPAGSVEALEFASDRLLWLSTLTPKVEQVPAMDRVWPWTADRSPMGPGIRLGGQEYARGLVMVPRTRLTYELDGGYDTFEAVVGIEDRGGPKAHAVFRVLGDGKVLFERTAVMKQTPPERIALPTKGVKSLALEVDFGANFDVGDLCAFAEARVVRT